MKNAVDIFLLTEEKYRCGHKLLFKPESDTTVLKEYWFCIFTGIKNDISEKKTSQGER